MKELYELKDKLCDELKEYGKKDMSPGSLDVVDKLTHALKNLDKVIENYEGGYSGRMRNSRDYSYDENMVGKLRDLMREAPDERTRQEFKRFIQRVESM